MCFNTWQNEWCARSSVSPHGHMAGGKFRNAHQHGKPGNPHQQSTIIMNWLTFFSPCKIDMVEVFYPFVDTMEAERVKKNFESHCFLLSPVYSTVALFHVLSDTVARPIASQQRRHLCSSCNLLSPPCREVSRATINSNLRWIRNEVDCTGAASWQQVTESVRSWLGPGRQSGAASRQLKSAAPPPSLLLLMCLRLSRGGRRQCCCCCDVDFHSTPPLVREASPNRTTLP